MGIKKKFLDFFGDVDEEDEIEELEEEQDVVVKPQRPQAQPTPAPAATATTNNTNNSKTQTKTYNHMDIEKPEEKESKIMSIFGGGKKEENTKMKVSYVAIIRPKVFEDSRIIADSIKERKVVTFSLEFLEFEVGQRVIDFVSGAAYAMEAHLSKVTDKVLTSIPNGIGYEDIDTTLEDEKNGKSL